MNYEWDINKAIKNRRKHGIDFADAIPALEDPRRLEGIDDRFSYGEDRMVAIGMSSGHVLFVVTTMRNENHCRIISARKATRYEQDRYYADDGDVW